MKNLIAKAKAFSQAPNTGNNNQASTEGATGDSDTTKSRAIDVSETTNSDAIDSRANGDATVNQEAANNADTHDYDNSNSCTDSSVDVGGDDSPWIFQNKNVILSFKDYQSIVQSLISKHEALPLKSYINELIALTHILVLNKNQHSPTAKKVFAGELLDDLTEFIVSESMNYNLTMSEQQYMTMAKIINQLSLSQTTREIAFFELTLMSSNMNYNEKRLILGLTNL